MKTIFIVMLGLSFYYTNAQSKKIEPGIKLGIGFSSHSPNKVTTSNGQIINYSAQGSLIGGVKALFPLTTQFNLLPEMVMLGKGSRVDDSYSYLKTFYQFNLNALYRSIGLKGGFLLGAGPFVAFTNKNSIYDVDQYKTDAGINVLAGYQIPIGFSLELHYMKSFTKQTLGFDMDKREVTFSNIGITLGYFF